MQIDCKHRSAKLPKEVAEEDVSSGSKEPGRSAKDPGHLLASLNCASAQAKGNDGGLIMQRHDFALVTTVGPGVFSPSKVRCRTMPDSQVSDYEHLPVFISAMLLVSY